MHNQKLRLLSYIVMAYMLMAFTWWALLLFTKNKDAYQARRELMRSEMAAGGNAMHNDEAFEQTPRYQELQAAYKRQEQMIFGEATVFMLTLLAGLWFIHHSYHRQVQANQQQRNFLLAITHELKSPIAAVQLMLETLLKRNLPKEKTDELATAALKENERLLQLVENLLLSAKLESAFQPNFEETDLHQLLSDLVAKARLRYPGTQIIFEKTTSLPLLKLDQSSFAVLFNNLVDNATKYALPQPVVDVSLQRQGQTAVLTFADNGPGIPPGERRRVFEKFYRIGQEDTRQAKGTGLGLFIAAQIVKAHKGRIRISDNVPKGAVFSIEWPLSDA